MLTITVPRAELYNEETEEFEYRDEIVLQLEHSLVALSKWESKYEKPFLGLEAKTDEETLGYIQAMVLTEDAPDEVFTRLSADNMAAIDTYLNAKMSATWFNDFSVESKSSETTTSELIYYWLTVLNIPFQPTENWHLSRLFALIKIANVKNSKPKKMSRSEMAARQRELNEKRKRELGTNG